MTLHTRIAVAHPVPIFDLFDWVNKELLHVEKPLLDVRAGYLGNRPGQGLDAWFWITYNEDGPEHSKAVYFDADGRETETPGGQLAHPACAFTVHFDTAYGYNSGDAQCGDLHASYIVRLAGWLDQHNASFQWQLEGTGAWYRDLNCIDKLGAFELVSS